MRRLGVFAGWSRDRGGRLSIGMLGYAAAYLLWQLTGWGGAEHRSLISDAAFLPVSLLGAGLALRTSRHPALDERTRRAWRILAMASLLYWMGDALWFGYSHLFGTEPFPSWADAAYLAFYPVMLVGMLRFPTAARSRTDRAKFWLDNGTVVLAGWMVVWFYVLGPVARDRGTDLLTNLITMAYPVMDLVLILGIAAVALRRTSEGSRGALGILGAGLLLFVVADIGFGYASVTGNYAGGGWPDSLWMIGQVLMGVGAQYQWWRTSNAGPSEGEDRRTTQAVSRLPYAAIAVSFALLLFVARSESPYPLGGLLVGAVMVTALVVARQITVMHDNARLVAELRSIAMTDVLTGLRNRRHFFEEGEREFARARRFGRPLTAVMLDIDRFKVINDTYGHAVGDDVLQIVAEALREGFRRIDLVGRYGGDELVALLPEADVASAVHASERIAARIREHRVPVSGGALSITLSVGVASDDGCADLSALLGRADRALYLAKQAGRDQVRAASGVDSHARFP